VGGVLGIEADENNYHTETSKSLYGKLSLAAGGKMQQQQHAVAAQRVTDCLLPCGRTHLFVFTVAESTSRAHQNL
jgi:hypothetical protein